MLHKHGNNFCLPLVLLDVDALVAGHFGANDAEKSGARGKKWATASTGAKQLKQQLAPHPARRVR